MRALLAAALVALAGCSAVGPPPTATNGSPTSTDSPPPEPTPTIVVERRLVGGERLAVDRVAAADLRAENHTWLNYTNRSKEQRRAFRTAVNRSEVDLRSAPFGGELATYAVAYEGEYYRLSVGLWDDAVTRTVRPS